MKRLVAGVLLTLLALRVTDAQRPLPRQRVGPNPEPSRPMLGDSVIVERQTIRLSVPLPVISPSAGPHVMGFYAWQLAVPGPNAFSIVLMSDSALRTTEVNEITRSLTLRRCPTAQPASLRECTIPVAALVYYEREAIRALVTDVDLVMQLRAERPLYFVRTTIEPRGRTESAEKLWIYTDRRE